MGKKRIKTKAEAVAAAKRVTKLKKEFETLKTGLKKLDAEQVKAEKRMKALSARSKALPEAIRLVKTLNTAWINGAEKKAAVKKKLIEEYKAVLDYKKRNP